MKKRLFFCAAVVFILLGEGSPAFASTWFLDTGIPAGPGWGMMRGLGVAVEFTVPFPTLLEQVDGYFQKHSAIPSTMTLAIYGSGGGIPDTARELYAGTFTIAYTGQDRDWQRSGRLGLLLAPGVYWAAFEARAKDTGSIIVCDAPYPAQNEAFGEGSYDHFQGLVYQNLHLETGFGMRVSGNPVPLPGAVWMLAPGLAGLAAWRRKSHGRRTLPG